MSVTILATDTLWSYLWETDRLQRWPMQIDLAHRLRRSLASATPPTIGLYEAPTGSGKTLAMLIEGVAFARVSGEPVWIATARRDLQAQFLDAAALIETALDGLHEPPLTVTRLDGLDHTLCQHLLSLQPPDIRHQIDQWLETSPEGHLNHFPAELPRAAVSMSSTSCYRDKCGYYDTCFAHTQRRQLAQSDLVITNHAIMAAQSRRPFLDPPRTLILDEAHLFERAIRHILTFSVTPQEIERHVRAFLKRLPAKGRALVETKSVLNTLLLTLAAAFHELDPLLPQGRSMLHLSGVGIAPSPHWRGARDHAFTILQYLRSALTTLTRLEHRAAVDPRQYEVLRNELLTAQINLEAFHEVTSDRYCLLRNDSGSISFLRTPLHIAGYAKKRIWDPLPRALLLSGTLSSNGPDPFLSIRSTLGIHGTPAGSTMPGPFGIVLEEHVYPIQWTPSFDIKLAAPSWPEVFIARDIHLSPLEATSTEDSPTLNPLWVQQTQELIIDRDRLQPNGIIVLCTSYAMQTALSHHLADSLSRPLIIQEQHRMPEAIQQFLAAGPRAILLTVAGWEGLDLPNAYTQELIITKLPFPTRPRTVVPTVLEQALGLNLSGTAEKRFTTSSLYFPHILRPAITLLRQALVRIIRSPSDSGTVWITDRRLQDPPLQLVFFGGPHRRYLYPSTVVSTFHHQRGLS
jgi:ATP-dependent DNA helicase DinG